ncbi:MAG TPA: hypothetical protein VLM79_01470 [Kofleriaceae bacterium]|nr:hypothetical protein [Kofleriaceae bacterium]
MLASPADLELAKDVADVAEAEVAPAEAEVAAEAQISTEGPLPEAAEAATDTTKTASEQAFGSEEPKAAQINEGMYAPEEYKAACEAAEQPDKWSDNYWRGHTEATQWNQPYEVDYSNHFSLKKTQSASQALKDFITGPTVGDWRVIAVAVEMDELRDTLGDRRFDQLFGSSVDHEDEKVDPEHRLTLTSAMYTTPFYDQMWTYAQEADAADRAPQEDPEAPQVAATLEEKPETAVEEAPAPELIADELGMQREQELA